MVVQELLELLNGKWNIDDGIPVHHCINAECCKQYNKDYCAWKITRALFRTVFSKRPPSPASIKWTKFGPCSDWVFCANSINGILRRIFELAFKAMSDKMCSRSTLSLDHQRLHVDLAQDIDWAAVNGRRLKDL